MSGIGRRAFFSILCVPFFWALPASAFEFEGVDGKSYRPLEGKKPAKAVVLIFTATDCPVANYFQPTIRRLAEEFGKQAVGVFQVYPDADTDKAAAKKHAREYKITTPQVLDPKQKLAELLGAEKTPEAVILDAEGEVVYRGRIDDTYAALGKKRAKPTTHDLKSALEAVLAGKKPKVKKTEAVGCYIDFVARN